MLASVSGRPKFELVNGWITGRSAAIELRERLDDNEKHPHRDDVVCVWERFNGHAKLDVPVACFVNCRAFHLHDSSGDVTDVGVCNKRDNL